MNLSYSCGMPFVHMVEWNIKVTDVKCMKYFPFPAKFYNEFMIIYYRSSFQWSLSNEKIHM